MIDAPLTTANGEGIYLTEAFKSARGNFVLLQSSGDNDLDMPGCHSICIGSDTPLRDNAKLFAKRYDAANGAAYLLRPDGYVAARFKKPTLPVVQAAMARATAQVMR